MMPKGVVMIRRKFLKSVVQWGVAALVGSQTAWGCERQTIAFAVIGLTCSICGRDS